MRVLTVYLLTGLLVLLTGSADLFSAVTIMALDLVLLIAFLKFCLYTRNTPYRFNQTFLACLGIGIIFQLLALPLVAVLNTGAEAADANNAVGGLIYLILVSWQVTVIAHVLRHAMDMVLTLTLLLSFSYYLLVIFLSNQLMLLLGVS